MAHLPKIYKSFPQSIMIAERNTLAHKSMIWAAIAIPLILIGMPFTLTGIFAAVLKDIYWPVLTGVILLAATVISVYSAFRLLSRWIVAPVEPPKLRKVFISYRTTEHAEYVEPLAKTIFESGYEVLLFGSDEKAAHNREGYLALLRQIGFFQAGGLDSVLLTALVHAHCLVYCVPVKSRKLSLLTRVRDGVDSFFTLLVYQGTSASYIQLHWYLMKYGIEIPPFFGILGKSWQSWELNVAEQVGLPIVKVFIGPDFEGNDDKDISWLRPESLENDFNQHALERIRKATPPALKLTPTPGMLTAILMYFFTVVAGLAISGIAIAVFLVVQAFL